MKFTDNNWQFFIILTAIWVSGLASVSTAQPTEGVRLYLHVEGLPDRRLPGLIDQPAQAFVPADSLPAITARALRALAKNGYPLAEIVCIEEEAGAPPTVAINIELGLPLEVQWIAEGDSGEDTVSRRYSESLLKETAQSALDSLTDAGYPLAEVSFLPRAVALSDRLKAEVARTVQSGPFLRVNSVRFPGAVNTRAKTLTRISRIHRGNAFSRTVALRAVEYLQREDYIASVGPAGLTVVGPGLVDVSIPLREQRANQINAAAAYDPNAERPVGQVRLLFGNLMGTGRSLRINWESLRVYRRRSSISYREPWLFGQPVDAETGFSQLSDDSTGTTTAFKFSAEWTPRLRMALRSETGWETFAAVDPHENRYTFTLEGGLKWDGWDHSWNPRRGWRAETSRRLGFRSNRFGARTNLTRDRASFQSVAPMVNRLVFYVRGALDDSRGGDLLIEDVVRLGGAGTMRGYSEESYPTEGAVWGGLECRWRPDRGGYVGLFTDQGWRYRRFGRDEGRRSLTSYGLTGKIEVKAGLIGLDLGWTAGEPFQLGRLHVSFENRF